MNDTETGFQTNECFASSEDYLDGCHALSTSPLCVFATFQLFVCRYLDPTALRLSSGHLDLHNSLKL